MTSLDSSTSAVSRRTFTWRQFRRLPIGLAVAGTMVACFFVVENWRGRRAWAAVCAEAESLGVSFDVRDWRTATPARAGDFSATPLLAHILHPGSSEGASVVMRLQPPNGLPGRPPGSDGEDAAPWGFPLEAWRTYLGRPDLDAYLAPVSADLDAIVRDCAGEGARLSLDPLASNHTVAGAMKRAADALAMRGALRLEQGKTDAAAVDLRTIWRLAALLQDHPDDYFEHTCRRITRQGLDILRAGMERRVWSDAQLAAFDESLARIDALACARRVWPADFARDAAIVIEIAERPKGLARIEATGADPELAKLKGYWFLPSGWIYQNLAVVGRAYLHEALPAVEAEMRHVRRAPLMDLQARVKSGRLSPYPCAAFMQRGLRRIGDKGTALAAAQTRLNLARVAVAVERHRLAAGAFPDRLDVLDKPIRELTDVMGGRSFRYRIDGGGGYRLYGLGANGEHDLVW